MCLAIVLSALPFSLKYCSKSRRNVQVISLKSNPERKSFRTASVECRLSLVDCFLSELSMADLAKVEKLIFTALFFLTASFSSESVAGIPRFQYPNSMPCRYRMYSQSIAFNSFDWGWLMTCTPSRLQHSGLRYTFVFRQIFLWFKQASTCTRVVPCLFSVFWRLYTRRYLILSIFLQRCYLMHKRQKNGVQITDFL